MSLYKLVPTLICDSDCIFDTHYSWAKQKRKSTNLMAQRNKWILKLGGNRWRWQSHHMFGQDSPHTHTASCRGGQLLVLYITTRGRSRQPLRDSPLSEYFLWSPGPLLICSEWLLWYSALTLRPQFVKIKLECWIFISSPGFRRARSDARDLSSNFIRYACCEIP